MPQKFFYCYFNTPDFFVIFFKKISFFGSKLTFLAGFTATSEHVRGQNRGQKMEFRGH